MNKFAKVYYNPRHPASFGSIHDLWKHVGGSKSEVRQWLERQNTYTLHKPARKKFKRNRIHVAGIDDQFEADLIDVQGIAKYNNNFKYLLTCIDSLSKYAFVVPIKDKSGVTLVKAFKTIFKKRIPRKLRTDKGKEFVNKQFQTYLKKKNIIFFTSNNETKAAIVERFNRTLRSKMWRYFTATNQQRYLDVLPQLVESYNNSVHSTIGVTPASVNVTNAETIWRKVYNYPSKLKKKKPLYMAGDLVRLNKSKKTFEKGYRHNWTKEIFQVNHVYNKALPEYSIVDLEGEEILGRFLEPELQKVVQESYKVKQILKKNKDSALVLWKGYPNTLKTWIPAKNLNLYQ